MPRSLNDIAKQVQGRVVGKGDVLLNSVASMKAAGDGDLVFVEHEEALAEAIQSQATAVIAGDFAEKRSSAKPLLIVSHPRLAFCRAAEFLRPSTGRAPVVHPSAVIARSARVASNATIEAHVAIGEGVEVGDLSRIGAGSVIGDGVHIGHGCNICPRVTIYPGVRLGDRVTVHAGAVLGSDGFGYVRDKATGWYEKFPQIGRLEIENDVDIGANSTIDRGALEVTRIGRGTKIDNLVHVGHNVQIAENVVIAAQTGFSGSITVEKDAVIGGQVGVGEHATIGEGVMLGGQSGVLPKKILRGKGIAFWGTPAKPLREYLRELAVMARLAKKA